MTHKIEKEFQDKLRRLEIVKRWDERLKNLSERDKLPMSANAFCKKYGLHAAQLSRARKLIHVPEEEFLKSVESAHKKKKV